MFRQEPHSSNPEWRFVGHADHDFARYYMPDYEIRMLGGKRFFVMSAQATSGTGIHMKWARWYELGATGLREVLSLPAEGGEAIFTDQYLFREFDSKVVNRADNTGTETIQVKFTAQYSGSGALIDETRQIPLFTRSQTAIYSRTRGESAFLLDPMRSDVGEEEIRTVYNLGITCENFLAFNLNDVVKIASAGNKTLKEWFRRYIGTCRPSADRTRALEALTH